MILSLLLSLLDFVLHNLSVFFFLLSQSSFVVLLNMFFFFFSNVVYFVFHIKKLKN